MGRGYRPEDSLPDDVVVDGVCVVFFAMAEGVLGEVRFGEDGGRVGGVDGELALGAHLLIGFYAGGDVFMDIALAVQGVVADLDEDFGLGGCSDGS